ncbi:pyridoxal-dependent decarboxylase [Streptococcus ruminantium]|uniref:pyridoxal-dependent decarboxylase n=1 Tax=Streptococcus ruminantium TaxID=1917441 RepID=UPI0012DC3117|nr:pyridoxal-dependent decarboxylase [Streptococcus ruminantium]
MFYKKLQKIMFDSINKYVTTYSNSESPCLVYDFGLLEQVLFEFKKQIPENFNYKFFYAIKANANEEILKYLSDRIDGVDVASLAELKIAKKFFSSEKISINGPAFTCEDIKLLNREGYRTDINYPEYLINNFQDSEIGIRIMEVDEQNNSLSRFGINIFDDNYFHSIEIANITRLHLHFGEKNINFIRKLEDTLIQFKKMDKLKNITEINIGGGFIQLLMSNQLNNFFLELMKLYKMFGIEDKIVTLIEPGNALVKFSGYMVAKPINVSEESGKQIITVNTSIYTNTLWFTPKIITTLNPTSTNRIHSKIYGNTCFEYDKYSEEIYLPKVSTESSLVFFPMGAYVKSSHSNLHSNKFMSEVYLWTQTES